MSRQISVQCEVKNMTIMKDTLKQLGHNFNENSETEVSINRSYHNIVINSETGSFTYDDSNKIEADTIRQTYMTNFFRDQAIREGNQVQEEVTASGEVILRIV